MIVFGITGGIACGKSTVTKTIRSNGILVLDADIIARQVVVPGTKGFQKVVHYFGERILDVNGSINRQLLGKIVFNNQNEMHKLNMIMQPLIQDEVDFQIENNKNNALLGYDAALICELDIAHKYRPLIVASCPKDMQLQRLMSRNNLSYDDALSRINAQMPSLKKIKMADYVIDTSQDISHNIHQTEIIIRELRKLI